MPSAGRMALGYLPERLLHARGTPRIAFLPLMSGLMAATCLGLAFARLPALYPLSALAGFAFGEWLEWCCRGWCGRCCCHACHAWACWKLRCLWLAPSHSPLHPPNSCPPFLACLLCRCRRALEPVPLPHQRAVWAGALCRQAHRMAARFRVVPVHVPACQGGWELPPCGFEMEVQVKAHPNEPPPPERNGWKAAPATRFLQPTTR